MIIAEHRSYVAGRWVEGDEALAVENPADESHVTDVSVTPLAEVGRAIAEARRRFDDGRVGRRCRRRSGPGCCTRSSTTSRRTATALVATMVAEAGQPTASPSGSQLRTRHRSGRAHDRPLPLAVARGAQPGPGRRAGAGPGRAQHAAPRAGRCRHRHHAVQRGDHHGLPEAHPGAHGGQLGDPAAEPAHADLVAGLRRRRRRRPVCRRAS